MLELPELLFPVFLSFTSFLSFSVIVKELLNLNILAPVKLYCLVKVVLSLFNPTNKTSLTTYVEARADFGIVIYELPVIS